MKIKKIGNNIIMISQIENIEFRNELYKTIVEFDLFVNHIVKKEKELNNEKSNS